MNVTFDFDSAISTSARAFWQSPFASIQCVNFDRAYEPDADSAVTVNLLNIVFADIVAADAGASTTTTTAAAIANAANAAEIFLTSIGAPSDMPARSIPRGC
ncbi:hypothetical protein [Demequina iriomotensis]|uniref:hypothetical protein n=1 Tax=Demequina iriomotensis TaxID=1536641 RepID=UPI001E2B9BDF|nr:hypothetical protein [Demequina iriomotensis]